MFQNSTFFRTAHNANLKYFPEWYICFKTACNTKSNVLYLVLRLEIQRRARMHVFNWSPNLKYITRKKGYFGLSLLHSRRLRLYILSVRFLLCSSSQGSKIRSNFKQAQMTKVTVSMCWHGTNITKVYGDLFVWHMMKSQRSKKGQIKNNFKWQK